jgi:hypothetical protein
MHEEHGNERIQRIIEDEKKNYPNLPQFELQM